MTIVDIIEEDLCGISCLYESLKVVISAMQGMPIKERFYVGQCKYWVVWVFDVILWSMVSG